MHIGKPQTMAEKNMLKSEKFINMTRKVNKLYARVDEHGVARAGTPYPYKTAVGRNLLMNANFENPDFESTGWKSYGGVSNEALMEQIEVEGKSMLSVTTTPYNPSHAFSSMRLEYVFNPTVDVHEVGLMTLSFKAKKATDRGVGAIKEIRITSEQGGYGDTLRVVKNLELTDTLTNYDIPFNHDEDFKFGNISIALGHNEELTDLIITDIKLEIGELTEFTLSPEDGGEEPRDAKDREGLIFEDIDFHDVQDKRKAGALMVRGVVEEKRLPIEIEPETKKKLRNINFM